MIFEIKPDDEVVRMAVATNKSDADEIENRGDCYPVEDEEFEKKIAVAVDDYIKSIIDSKVDTLIEKAVEARVLDIVNNFNCKYRKPNAVLRRQPNGQEVWDAVIAGKTLAEASKMYEEPVSD